LCDGVGAIFIALSTMGMSFSGMAAESCENLRDFLRKKKNPQIWPFGDIARLNVASLRPKILAAQATRILL